VTQEDATEPPFRNEFWDHDAPGLYVDVVSGEPLFTSLDKFDSHCGWPSFTKPVERSMSSRSDDLQPLHGAHRGALGPWRQPSRPCVPRRPAGDRGGLRYCINSASLRFIPEALEEARCAVVRDGGGLAAPMIPRRAFA
jgi:methionine-R-sulfoxide reductase